MPTIKFTDKYKNFLKGELEANRIDLCEAPAGVRLHYLEKFKDVSQDLFSKWFKEVKESYMKFGDHRKCD